MKGTFNHDGSVGIIVDDDTSKTIPDLVIDSGDKLILSSNIKLPSNLVVNGTITSNGRTFTTTGIGNVTINFSIIKKFNYFYYPVTTEFSNVFIKGDFQI